MYLRLPCVHKRQGADNGNGLGLGLGLGKEK